MTGKRVTVGFLLNQFIVTIGLNWAFLIFYIHAYVHMDKAEQDTTLGKVFFAAILMMSVSYSRFIFSFLHLTLQYGTIIDTEIWSRSNITMRRWPKVLYAMSTVGEQFASIWLMVECIPFNDKITSHEARIAVRIISVFTLIFLCLVAAYLLLLLALHIRNKRQQKRNLQNANTLVQSILNSAKNYATTRGFVSDDAECPICQMPMPMPGAEQPPEAEDSDTKTKTDEQEAVVTISCGHRYHQGCLASWIVQSATCPMCRVSLAQDCVA